MMLQPESLPSDVLNRIAHCSGYASVQASKQKQVPVEPSVADVAFIETLIPKGVSPAKRAVIERLATLWLTGNELDVVA